MVKLSKSQLSMLAATFRCVRFIETRGQPGVFARGAGQWSTIRSLERLGLLEFKCMGGDIDGEAGGDVALYEPTEAGIAELIEREEIGSEQFVPAVFYALRGLLPAPAGAKQ